MTAPTQVIHPDYEWSQDYDLLLRLMQRGEVIGYVLYGGWMYDPVRFRMHDDKEMTYSASARGIFYMETWHNSQKFATQEEEFKAKCTKLGARFLVPQRVEAT